MVWCGIKYEFRAGTLQYDAVDDEFYFHITTRKYDGKENGDDTEGSVDTEHHTVLGTTSAFTRPEVLLANQNAPRSGDVNSLAVASIGRFWQGDDYDHRCREFEQRRAKLQQRGTQAAHNAVLRLGKREEAWRKQYLHTVANEIVTEAVEHDCDVIVFEELTNIRERLPQAEWHHIWAFRRLYEYIEYKAPERGVSVKQVAERRRAHKSEICGMPLNAFSEHTSRRAYEWWDSERQRVPADYWDMIAGSPHQSQEKSKISRIQQIAKRFARPYPQRANPV